MFLRLFDATGIILLSLASNGIYMKDFLRFLFLPIFLPSLFFYSRGVKDTCRHGKIYIVKTAYVDKKASDFSCIGDKGLPIMKAETL